MPPWCCLHVSSTVPPILAAKGSSDRFRSQPRYMNTASRLDVVRGIRKNLEMGGVGRDPNCRRADELRLDSPATNGRKGMHSRWWQQRGELPTGCVTENRCRPGQLSHLLDKDRGPGPAVRRARQTIADRGADQLDAISWRANQGRPSVRSHVPLLLPTCGWSSPGRRDRPPGTGGHAMGGVSEPPPWSRLSAASMAATRASSFRSCSATSSRLDGGWTVD